MKTRSRFLFLALGFWLGWTAFLSQRSWARDLTLRLLDQNGALIPASQFEVFHPREETVQKRFIRYFL